MHQRPPLIGLGPFNFAINFGQRFLFAVSIKSHQAATKTSWLDRRLVRYGTPRGCSWRDFLLNQVYPQGRESHISLLAAAWLPITGVKRCI
jgi:hypothetical protein